MQRFLRILKVAVLVNILISLVIGVSASFAEREPFYFLYVGILLFGSMFFPLIVASALHYFIGKRTSYQASLASFLMHSVVLFGVFQIGLLICAFLEVVLDFSLQNAVNHYNQEFGRMLWLTAFIAFAIPLTYFILDKRKRLEGIKQNNSYTQN